MANTSSPRSLSSDDSFAAAGLLARLPISTGQLSGAEYGLAVRLSDLGWTDFEDRGSRSFVVLTSRGSDALSEAQVAAAIALGEWARRVPLS
jgi:hypothetical protein